MHAFRIGRIFGIELRVDVSWLFIFVLMTWNLSAVFAHWHVEWSSLEVLVVSLAAALLFFGCVLLHELAHSAVALAYGVPVRSITLFLFGGVSNIEHEPPSPGAEFLTAIVGPLTSIALGVLFGAIAGFAMGGAMASGADPWEAIASLGPITTLLAWLGPINIVIGVFNLVPGFPLDGGRVLRSIVWRITGDLYRATHVVARLGQAIGWLFVLLGIAMSFGTRVPFFGTGLVGGLWLAFIGWFLAGAAMRAMVRLDIDEALAGHFVSELMRREGPVVSPDDTLALVVHEYFMRTDERAVPVVRDGRLLGLVAMVDVGHIAPEQWATTSVKAAMRGVETLVTTTPGTPLLDAFERLTREDIEQLPVIDVGSELVGMLRRSDVTRWLELVWRGGRRARREPPGRRGRPPLELAHGRRG